MRLLDINRMPILPFHARRREQHRHRWHELVYCCTKGYAVHVEGRRLEPSAGTACYYPPGLVHAPAFRERCTVIVLQWEEDDPGMGRHRQVDDRLGRLLVLLDWLLEEWIATAPLTGTCAERILACLGSLLDRIPEHAPARRMDPPLRRMLRTIRDTFHEPLKLDDLAAAAGLSKWQLIRSCTAQLGDTPGAILRRTRLQAARNLLADGRELGAVVRAVGYGNARALSRALRAHFGRSVAELRRIPLAHELQPDAHFEDWWRRGG